MRAFLLTPVAALLLAGCAAGPDYKRAAFDLPAHYVDVPSAAAAHIQPAWWTLFDDAKLNTLIDRALAQNTDVLLALSRIEQSEAFEREVRASFLPEIDASVAGSNSKYSELMGNASLKPRHSRTAAINTAYEIDLWGRARRNDEAARANLAASRFARDAIKLSVAGEVSRQYLALRALDAQIKVSEATHANLAASLSLVEARLKAGLVPAMDAYQAQAALEAHAVQLSALKTQRALREHQLALLTADPALKLEAADVLALPVPPTPPAGLPAALIDNRPDVQAAEQKLIAANAGIGIAKTAYFPRFMLTGSLGRESPTLSDLFAAGASTGSIGLALTAPLLDFGRTSARVDQAAALSGQAAIAYRDTLHVAFKEVRDAIVSLREASEAEAHQKTRADLAAKALDLAQRRYSAGKASYLEVLDAQRTEQDASLSVITTRATRLAAAVELFKALGGGWKAG